MRILLSNDDGYFAPGLAALAEGLAPLGEITVVAPDGKRAYVATIGKNAVAVIDLTSGTVTGYLATGAGPDGLAYSQVFSRGGQ